MPRNKKRQNCILENVIRIDNLIKQTACSMVNKSHLDVVKIYNYRFDIFHYYQIMVNALFI